jgi:signal peptidase I
MFMPRWRLRYHTRSVNTVSGPWGRTASLGTILVAVLSCTLGCDWGGPRVYRVPTHAMEPTIKAGAFILVMRWPLGKTSVARGDIVVFRDPDEPESLYVKRAVAIAGETIELREGKLFLDGLPYHEPYVMKPAADGSDPFGPTKVPEGHIFVMGDNRDSSRDSRSFGPVPLKSVVGWMVF